MAIKIVIPMRLPDLNDYINACRANRYSGANFKRQIENDCIIFIKSALRGRVIVRGGFTFHWYEPNEKRDKDNIAFAKKFVMDAFQKSQIIKNDGWKQVEYYHDDFFIDKDNPRVEVIIEEMGAA